MTSEALKAQTKSTNTPTDTPTDLISRQDAIDALGEEPDIWNDTEEEWAYRNAWVEHISAIKSLPSAEPKTGKWVEAVKDGVLSYTDVYAMCDQCHKVKFNGWGMNYCPNCGARMVREDGK